MVLYTLADHTEKKLWNYAHRLLQPRYWPELWRRTLKKLTPLAGEELTQAEARRYCSTVAVSVGHAMQQLGFPSSTLRSFATDHPQRLAEASARVDLARGHMGGGADLDLLYTLCLVTGATRVIETGVAFGWSSLAILSAISGRQEAKLVSVDLPYLKTNLDDLVGLAIPPDLKQLWSLHRGADRDQLPQALAEIGRLDVAHYDSDKSYAGRQRTYPLLFAALKPGGLLISDDIEDNLAFRDFASKLEKKIEKMVVVHAAHEDKYIGIVRKSR